MNIDDIRASLDGASAKIWVRERDDLGARTITTDGPHQLVVRRWVTNERDSPKGKQWRWTPRGEEIEVKGALLNQAGVEYIPASKRDRSCQIFYYGFT